MNQYTVYMKMWFAFARQGLKPTIRNVIEFLTHLSEKGYNYNQLCAARSAVVVLSENPLLGKHPVLKRFMKGIFETKPTFPRMAVVWDIKCVFDYFRKMTEPLSMEMLGKKLVMLIALLAGGQRSQTINTLKVTDIKIAGDKCIIPVYDPIKQTRQGKHIKPLEFRVYLKEPKLCVITTLTEYLKITKQHRRDTATFISYQRPFKPVFFLSFNIGIVILVGKELAYKNRDHEHHYACSAPQASCVF